MTSCNLSAAVEINGAVHGSHASSYRPYGSARSTRANRSHNLLVLSVPINYTPRVARNNPGADMAYILQPLRASAPDLDSLQMYCGDGAGVALPSRPEKMHRGAKSAADHIERTCVTYRISCVSWYHATRYSYAASCSDKKPACSQGVVRRSSGALYCSTRIADSVPMPTRRPVSTSFQSSTAYG